MLTLTPGAVTVVKQITESSSLTSDGAGLRISQAGPESQSFDVTIVEGPQADDAIVEEEGARVFLGQTASETLDDKVLDAQLGEGGAVQFTIAQQA
jgi:iron-sulfur cluster assembly protein